MKPARTFWRVGAGLLLLLSVCGLAAVFGRDRYRAMLASVDARALRTYTVVEARDADRGIQHDGYTAVIFAGLSDAEMARVIDRSAAWRVYTPDAPVSWLLYGGMHDGVWYRPVLSFADELSGGYYYFMDLQSRSCDSGASDIAALFGRKSLNFVLAVLEPSAKRLVFFQYDS